MVRGGVCFESRLETPKLSQMGVESNLPQFRRLGTHSCAAIQAASYAIIRQYLQTHRHIGLRHGHSRYEQIVFRCDYLYFPRLDFNIVTLRYIDRYVLLEYLDFFVLNCGMTGTK